MEQKPKFLDKVRVKQFAYNVKTGEGRELCKYPNHKPEAIFIVIGTVNVPQGTTVYYSDEGYIFRPTGSTQLFIVANTIGVRYKATLDDLEKVED